jgi:hypothetical protein
MMKGKVKLSFFCYLEKGNLLVSGSMPSGENTQEVKIPLELNGEGGLNSGTTLPANVTLTAEQVASIVKQRATGREALFRLTLEE